MHVWVWRHLRIELPEGWEMLQFSRNQQAGRCAWADRHQFRAELSWRQVTGPPDLKRLASDYLSKLKLDGTMPDASAARVGGWQGLRGHEGGLPTSRFSRYLAEEGCLVELVLLWPGELDTSLEASILGSVAAEPPWPGGLRRWRAFGLDLLASGGLDLVECRVQPALARLAFRDPKGTRHETFERLGMVPQWLDGSVRDWLVRQVPQDVRVVREGRSEASGHQVEAVEGLRRGGLFRRPTPYATAAWLCPSDGRLYCASIRGPDADGRGLAGTRLSCCEGMTLRD